MLPVTWANSDTMLEVPICFYSIPSLVCYLPKARGSGPPPIHRSPVSFQMVAPHLSTPAPGDLVVDFHRETNTTPVRYNNNGNNNNNNNNNNFRTRTRTVYIATWTSSKVDNDLFLFWYSLECGQCGSKNVPKAAMQWGLFASSSGMAHGSDWPA